MDVSHLCWKLLFILTAWSKETVEHIKYYRIKRNYSNESWTLTSLSTAAQITVKSAEFIEILWLKQNISRFSPLSVQPSQEESGINQLWLPTSHALISQHFFCLFVKHQEKFPFLCFYKTSRAVKEHISRKLIRVWMDGCVYSRAE